MLSSIPAARSLPDDISVIIEIAAFGSPIKYEVDKNAGLLAVDRLMTTAMHYPCNYGFIPNTLGGDGDPLDVLVMTPYPLQPGCMIRCRALGLLAMEDEAGEDSKIIALPTLKICPHYAEIKTLDDLPELFKKSLVHFFEHYKDLEKGKWVKVTGWKGVSETVAEIQAGIEREKSKK